jgi:hypothetical protein
MPIEDTIGRTTDLECTDVMHRLELQMHVGAG